MSTHVHENLSAYLDRELPVNDSERVEGHLRGCAECTQHLADLAAVDEVARTLPDVAPPGYFDRLPSRVRQRLARPQARPHWRRPVWTAAAAAALLLAVVTPWLLRHSPDVPAPPAEVAQPLASPVELAAPPASRSAEPPVPAPARRNLSPDLEQKKERQTERLLARDSRRESDRYAESDRPADGSARARGEDFKPAPPPPAVLPPASSPPISSPRDELAAGRSSAAESAAEPPKAKAVLDDKAPTPSAPERLDEALPGKPGAPPAQAAPDGRATRDRNLSPSEARGYVGSGGATIDARYQALRLRQPSSLADARALREAWRAFARDHADSRWADEARVRVIEVGLQAYRIGGAATDRVVCRDDAEAYLQREDALQKARVQSLYRTVEP